MSKRMLIDAAHAEETRVVVLDGSRVEDFDFESASRKQLRGNIYLAKVTRVEPSLQAAFIEYGGNRHGFLAFNEIHPDYYQIPIADREALMREEAEETDEPPASARGGDDDDDADDDDDDVMGDEAARRNRRLMRRYKVQEVIKRKQIMLIQVVKVERGNKGAALTTYLSLAGRYGVLMPNTARGGGISRKIEAAADRKRLKSAVQSLDVPQGMGLIVRTAGAKRTKAELKRDYEYLMRLWENIREKTLHSIAPELIYEEEDLVKRAIRDMFDKDLEGIWVEGDHGFREARDFMRMIMPSQAKKVIHYRDPTPLFVDAKIEDVLAQIYSPVVPLKSGGYLRDQPDRSPGRRRRQLGQIHPRAQHRSHRAEDQYGGGRGSRSPTASARPGRPDCHRLHRHGRGQEQPRRREEAEGQPQGRPGPHPDGQDLRLRPDGDQPSAPAHRHPRRHHPRLRTLQWHGQGPLAGVQRPVGLQARHRDGSRSRGVRGGAVDPEFVSRAVGLYILNEKRAYLERVRAGHGLHVTVLIDDAIPQGEHRIERTETRDHDRSSPEAVAALSYAEEPVDDTVLGTSTTTRKKKSSTKKRKSRPKSSRATPSRAPNGRATIRKTATVRPETVAAAAAAAAGADVAAKKAPNAPNAPPPPKPPRQPAAKRTANLARTRVIAASAAVAVAEAVAACARKSAATIPTPGRVRAFPKATPTSGWKPANRRRVRLSPNATIRAPR